MGGIIDLLYGYVPALFMICCQVRDCHWGPSANSDKSTMSYYRCLQVLICLTLGYEHKVEYVRTLLVARLISHHPCLLEAPNVVACFTSLAGLFPEFVEWVIANVCDMYALYIVNWENQVPKLTHCVPCGYGETGW